MKLWATEPLGEFIEERSERLGEKPATIYSVTNEKGFVRSLDQFDKQVFSADTSNYKRVEFQDLAYNPSRINVGSIAMCLDKEGGAVSPMYIIVRCNPGLLPHYLLHFLKSETGLHQIRHRCEGAVRFQLKFRDLCAIPVLVPPLAEQERIIKLLDEADELGKLRAQADRRTAELVPALFYEMFGDPESNPKRWPIKQLGEVTTINPRLPKEKQPAPDADVSFVPMVAVDETRGIILASETRPYKEVAKGYTSFQNRDVLFAKITPCMQNGKSAIASNLAAGLGFGSTEFHVLRPTEGVMSEYIFWLIRRPSFRAQAEQNFTGSVGQQRVPARFMENYSCPVPPLSLQKEFADRVFEIRMLEAEQAASRLRLKALFQSLLHQAFNGEL